jgi:ferritin-like metal-binding protein YciE
MNALKTLFLNLLAERYDAEKRLVGAFPRMAKSSASKDVRQLLQRHRKETVGHVKKAAAVFNLFGAKIKAAKCAVTISLLADYDEIAAEYKGSPAFNAALVSCLQKIEHLEIASYGCLAEWAAILGNKSASSLLRDVLAEEKAADQALNYLARTAANPEALGESSADDRDSISRHRIANPVVRRAGVRPRTFNRIHPVLM